MGVIQKTSLWACFIAAGILIANTTISRADLVLYLPFDDDTADRSQFENHGSASGDPDFVAGQAGMALRFDAVDDQVIVPSHETLDITDSITLSVSRSGTACLTTTAPPRISRLTWTEAIPETTGTTVQAAREFWGPVTGSWVQLAVSCDGSQTRIYYNGLRVDTLDAADTLFGQIAIGINRGMTLIFAGSVDDVRVYNRALSDGEIAGLAGLTESIPKSL